MATSHGSTAEFIGNGFVLTDYLNSAGFGANRDAAEASTFGVSSKKYVPGLKDTTMNIEGIYDGATDAIDDILSAAFSSNVDGLHSYFPFGQKAVGNLAFTMDTSWSSYEINTDVGDVAQISAEIATGATGKFGRGFVARVLAAAASGGNTSGFDAGAGFATTNPNSNIALVVHATSSNSLSVKLQHSTDNVSFTDVVGTSLNFGALRGSQRLVVSTMNLNRYTRVLWTGSGTFMAVIER